MSVVILSLFLIAHHLLPIDSILHCYACHFSYLAIDKLPDAWCSTAALIDQPREHTTRPCADWEKFCMTTVTTNNYAFTSIERGCTTACDWLCTSVGFGSNLVTCDDCCTGDYCNRNTSVKYYLDIMQRQYTSWVRPLPGELDYNRQTNARFPY